MTILFITKEIPYPPDSGHRIRSFHLLKALARGNAVHVLCVGGAEPIADEIAPYCASIARVPETARAGTLLLCARAALSIFSLTPLSASRRHSPRLSKAVADTLAKNAVDMIFCDGIHMAPHIPAGAENMVLAEHNIESTIIERYFRVEKNPLKKLYAFLEWRKMRRFEHRQWRRFSKIFTCSETDASQVHTRIGEQDVGVIPNGVDTGCYAPENNAEKPNSLIYSGLMNWRPNEDAALYFLEKIYPRITKEVPGVSFTIVGKGPTRALRTRAESDPSVTITGFVDDVRAYVHSHALFVVPLRIGSGTRLKILEAMAMGKAVVSTTIGCEGIDVTHGKDILIADTPEDFARGVIRLLSDPVLRGTIAGEGRKLVEERYSWEIIAKKLSEVI